MRSLKRVILDFIFNERPAHLSTTSLNYWLRIESKQEADRRKIAFLKRVKKNDQPTPIN